ncbi:hypothetical protein [Micromonospora sp. NPDC051141]|uniref:hypothetical protein n=1 Tax=Micromonospora sp. NPDC051141 TaxID=3364284 RepID=UPI0037A3560C
MLALVRVPPSRDVAVSVAVARPRAAEHRGGRVSVDDTRTESQDTAAMTEPDGEMPSVYLTVPGVEDLAGVIAMLRGAGATASGSRREFVVKGRLTAEQASAVWQLAQHVDSGTESSRLSMRVDPAGDLAAALDVMCPDGWTIDAFTPSDVHRAQPNRWWMEQQQLPRILRR